MNARGGQAPALRARKVLLAMRRSGSGDPELQSLGHAGTRGGQAPALRINLANRDNRDNPAPNLANRDNLVNPAHLLLISCSFFKFDNNAKIRYN